MGILEEKDEVIKELKYSLKQIEKELQNAFQIQKSFMPQESDLLQIKEDYHLDIKGYYQSPSQLGGDLWGMKRLSSNEVALYLIDLIGHGIPAAFDAARLHTLLDIHPFSFSDLTGFFEELNKILFQRLPRGRFATMIYCVINTHHNTLSYVTAGCPLPFLVKGEEGTVSLLEGSGLPLGVLEETSYKCFQVPFGPEDLLFLYSDALIETVNDKGVFLREPEVFSWLNSQWNSETNLRSVLSKFQNAYAPNLKDDLTLVMARYEKP